MLAAAQVSFRSAARTEGQTNRVLHTLKTASFDAHFSRHARGAATGPKAKHRADYVPKSERSRYADTLRFEHDLRVERHKFDAQQPSQPDCDLNISGELDYQDLG